MPGRKDGTEIASSFKVAMNDPLAGLNFLLREFLSDESAARSSIFPLQKRATGEREQG